MSESNTKLAKALREAGLESMATKAEEGYYNEVTGPLDLPIVTLVNHLRKAGTEAALALAKRVMQGDFDAKREEWDDDVQ